MCRKCKCFLRERERPGKTKTSAYLHTLRFLVGAGGLREPRRKGARVAAPSGCIVPWAARASCWPQPQQLLPVSAAGSGRRCCCSNPPLRSFCTADKTETPVPGSDTGHSGTRPYSFVARPYAGRLVYFSMRREICQLSFLLFFSKFKQHPTKAGKDAMTGGFYENGALLWCNCRKEKAKII